METLFKEVKINLSADVLRSKLAENIYKEIAARFIALNVVRMIALEAAVQEGKSLSPAYQFCSYSADHSGIFTGVLL
ncbi:MAG: hypothetical protein JXD22_13520 [Sedimentisphaerales bacterium]|nr:hypothetical protein [Sedimentisphaerales bacterium]